MSGHLIYRVSFHFIPTPAFVIGTSDHSHFTDKKTAGMVGEDSSEKAGESAPGRGKSLCKAEGQESQVGRMRLGLGAGHLGSAWRFYEGPAPLALPSGLLLP